MEKTDYWIQINIPHNVIERTWNIMKKDLVEDAG